MDKLQYDSFYKFMVSAGVVLVAAPLVGLYYLLCNGNQILISQAEYEALSTTSMQLVQQRDQTIFFILKVLPWLLGTLIVIGLGCLIYGGIKWHNIQKEIDEQTKLTTKEQKLNIEKLSASEIAAKAIDEMAEEHEVEDTVTSNVSLARIRAVKGIEIEDMCYHYIQKQYSRNYDIQQNVKFNNYACDILAVSKFDEIDYLFEIKYWTMHPSRSLLYRVINQIEDMKEKYETTSQRNCKCILLIVTVDNMKNEIQDYFERYMVGNEAIAFEIRVSTEDELK